MENALILGQWQSHVIGPHELQGTKGIILRSSLTLCDEISLLLAVVKHVCFVAPIQGGRRTDRLSGIGRKDLLKGECDESFVNWFLNIYWLNAYSA